MIRCLVINLTVGSKRTRTEYTWDDSSLRIWLVNMKGFMSNYSFAKSFKDLRQNIVHLITQECLVELNCLKRSFKWKPTLSFNNDGLSNVWRHYTSLNILFIVRIKVCVSGKGRNVGLYRWVLTRYTSLIKSIKLI